MLTVTWVKCGENHEWCSLEGVNLKNVYTEGVYVIWHGGEKPHIVRIGQGDVADRLSAHRNDPAILKYAKQGRLFTTWASVPAAQRDGIERYLADQYTPLIGDAFPEVLPIEVNLLGV